MTTGTVDANRQARLQRTSGLCDWIGVESVWSRAPHPVLVADMRPVGGPVISVDVGPLARLTWGYLAYRLARREWQRRMPATAHPLTPVTESPT